MATLIPPVNIASIEPYSEQQVIAALMEQLPAECRLYHNFEILTRSEKTGKNKGTVLQEGEIDAVVLWPGKGLLVLEVKGGEIRYCAEQSRWTSKNRNGTHDIQDPFQQAKKNMYRLIKSIEGETGSKLKNALTHGFAVIFPSSRSGGPLPHGADAAIVCDAKRLESIGRFVDGALKLWRRDSNKPAQMSFDFEQVHRAMLPAFNLMPSLKSRVAGDNEQLLRLTEDQRKYLSFASNIKRVRINGVAGSGKTLLAVEQARRYSRAGLRTLLLCYNKSLAAWIHETVVVESGDAPVDVHTFHDFCARACKEAVITFDPSTGDDFWTDQTPELLAEASHAIQPYDAIVVDEGQDFRETWWLAIEECLVKDGRLMIFCDPQQDIFGADGLDAIDVGDSILELPENCRNTQHIARFCDHITAVETSSPDSAPSGVPVKLQVEASDNKRLARIEELLDGWIKQEGLLPSQIAILSPWRPEKTCLADVEQVGRHQLTNSIEDWRKGKGVLQTTVRSFKGLEADVLLLIDIPKPDAHRAFSTADYYVACSRAKSVLHVLAKETAVKSLEKAA
ncbi:MAG: NERD domain-containing protein [Granulosicoccus sp.]